MSRTLLFLCVILLSANIAHAKVDLVTLPGRDTVQLTIYNAVDLTFVKESHMLNLKKGVNRLQFSWANTLIDPTSIDITPKAQAADIDIQNLGYPPRVENLGIWHISSRISGNVPVEISYFTSGLSWRAFYIATLSSDEKTMTLKGYIRVVNESGEDYEDAQTRVIVGKIQLLDEIGALARRPHPYGTPHDTIPVETVKRAEMAKTFFQEADDTLVRGMHIPRAKEIRKEGISEYFLYTIEGRELIPSGWSKRLPALEANAVPVVNFYRYEEEQFGTSVIRFLKFSNDKHHNLGETPIPGGILKAFRHVDQSNHLAYEGESRFEYIPVNEEIELDLGPAENVSIAPVMMKYETDQYLFDKNGDIIGWDEIRTYAVKIKNTRNIPITAEVRRHFQTPHWDLEARGDYGKYEKVDMDTVKFTLNLPAVAHAEFSYVLRTYHGRRAEER